MDEFRRINRLPPYVFSIVNELKMEARRKGEDIIDLGMGNPDLPTPQHIVDKLAEAIYNPKNHRYSASKGIAKLRLAITSIPLSPDRDFFEDLLSATKLTWPRPKMLIISYPHNPTTTVVDLDFFRKLVAFAKEYSLIIVHDFAYADMTFDGYRAPSILEVEGAKDVAVEFYSLSKSYSMAGWRVGFCVGNQRIVQALTKIKSYLDYGIFQPIQIAAIEALNGDQSCVQDIVNTYKQRRDTLCDGLARIGWQVEKPLGTMFVWGKIPEQFKDLGSLEFSKMMIREAKVAVSPGIGFGEYGDDHVRFALVENEHRTRQAIRGIRNFFQQHS